MSTLDLPSLGFHALSCRNCGRAPVLQSGRCWSCEPRPAARPVPERTQADHHAAAVSLTQRIRAHLARHASATTGEIAAAIGHRAVLVTTRLCRLRTEGRVTSSGSPLRWSLVEVSRG